MNLSFPSHSSRSLIDVQSQMRRMLPVGSEPEALTDDTTPLPVGVALAEGLGSMFRCVRPCPCGSFHHLTHQCYRYFVPRSKRFMPSFRRRHSAMGLQRSASIDSSALGRLMLRQQANTPPSNFLSLFVAFCRRCGDGQQARTVRAAHSPGHH